MADKDGGMAFPVPATDSNYFYEGMSLRDYFEAKAMAALISRYDGVNIDRDGAAQEIANSARKLADAMLAVNNPSN